MSEVRFGNGFANMMLLRMKKKVKVKEKAKNVDDKREQLRMLEEAALSAHQQNVMASTVLALAGDRMVPAKKPVRKLEASML